MSRAATPPDIFQPWANLEFLLLADPPAWVDRSLRVALALGALSVTGLVDSMQWDRKAASASYVSGVAFTWNMLLSEIGLTAAAGRLPHRGLHASGRINAVLDRLFVDGCGAP